MSVESAQKKTKTFKIATLCILILAVFAIVIVITFSQGKPDMPFRLSDEYYGTSEMLTGLTAEGYEKLLSEKRSFVVMVDKA